jgi:hypothetical protein
VGIQYFPQSLQLAVAEQLIRQQVIRADQVVEELLAVLEHRAKGTLADPMVPIKAAQVVVALVA